MSCTEVRSCGGTAERPSTEYSVHVDLLFYTCRLTGSFVRHLPVSRHTLVYFGHTGLAAAVALPFTSLYPTTGEVSQLLCDETGDRSAASFQWALMGPRSSSVLL